MKPFYFTRGFATNSSSSHSVMILKGEWDTLFPSLLTHDNPRRKNIRELDGSKDFLIASKKDKRRYFLARVLEGFSFLSNAFSTYVPHMRPFTPLELEKELRIRAILCSPTSTEQDRANALGRLGFKGQVLADALYALRIGIRETVNSHKALVKWGECESRKDLDDLQKRTSAGYDQYLPTIFPRDAVTPFLKAILPKDDPQLNESILSMEDLFAKDPYFGETLFLNRHAVSYSNAYYDWGPFDFFDMVLIAHRGEDGGDLRFQLMREICAFLERPDVVVIGGADDNDTGWDGETRCVENADAMCGSREIKLVQMVAPAGVRREAFSTMMFSFLDSRVKWGIQPQHKRLLSYTMEHYRRHSVIRRDPVYGHWTTQKFYRETGSRSRWTISHPTPPPRASVPDVVDIKITNKCPFACPYCYQASVPQGQHTPTAHILDVFDALSDWGVFELAIGGGEPTLHPDIHKILAYANARGIVPNITTRNKKWLTDPNNLAWIVECVGGVGFSVDTVEDVVALDDELEKSRLYKMEVLSDLHDTFVLTLWDLFDEWCVEHNLHKKAFWNNAPSIKSQINIHVVLGAHPKDQTLAVIKKARELKYKVLLLDFKQSGFAKGTAPHDYSFLPNFLKEQALLGYGFESNDFESNTLHSYPSISLDTPLAARFHKELIELGFAPESFDIEDGLFSFYIDATTEQAGPSSYAAAEKMRRYSPVGFDSLAQNLYGIFNSTPITRPHHTIRDDDALFG